MLVLAGAIIFFSYRFASAHGHTEVGDYELAIGFHTEPALQGEPNGLDLFVTKISTGESVVGLEETLRVEVLFGGATKELSLEPQFGQEGAYTAHLLPTEAGDYTWRIFGQINGTPVDVSMTSSPDTFSSVQPKSAISFPGAEPSSLELEAEASAAASSAQTALILGGLGAVLGLAGLVVGFLGYQAARRRAV
jgi:hypothetical protein